jgi:hypothetical protein
LVLIGLALSLAPGLPAMELAPEFVLRLVLPPVIYSSAFNMSWREFRFNLRPKSKSRRSPRSSIRNLSISRSRPRKTRFFRGSQRAAGTRRRSLISRK